MACRYRGKKITLSILILGDMKLTLVFDRFIRALWEDFHFTIGAT